MNDSADDRSIEWPLKTTEQRLFAAAVAHDLKSPVNNIVGQIGILEELQETTEEQRRRYEIIRQSALKIMNLLNSLRDLTSATGRPLRKKEVDITTLANRILQEHPVKDRTILSHVESGLHAYADENLIEDALENLIGNALKFTASKPVTKIDVGDVVIEGERYFFVRDNGVGFDQKYSHRLFRPFSRLHSQKEFDGSGIGLVTVRAIVERHGGKVRIESKVGAGTVLYFSLPSA